MPTEPRPCDCGKLVAEDEHHCWEHHVEEIKGNETFFIFCGECWHVYKTPEELVAAWRKEFPEVADDRPATEIYSCPICIHDF